MIVWMAGGCGLHPKACPKDLEGPTCPPRPHLPSLDAHVAEGLVQRGLEVPLQRVEVVEALWPLASRLESGVREPA